MPAEIATGAVNAIPPIATKSSQSLHYKVFEPSVTTRNRITLYSMARTQAKQQ